MAISYPVDVESTRWAVYRISTAQVVKENLKWPRADGQPVENLDPDLVPLRIVEAAQPAYDPATQRLERTAPVVDVNANTYTFGWQVVARPQEEIDAENQREQAKQAYQALINGTGTQLERLVRCERVLARVIRDQYGP